MTVRRRGSWIAPLLPLFALAGCSSESSTLELVTTELPRARLGEPYDQKIAVRGGEPPYAFALAAGVLPSGLELKAQTGQVSGIAGAPGAFGPTLRVSDAAEQVLEQQISLYVEPDPLVIETRSLSDAFQEQAYQAQLRATGGVPPLAWSLASGPLPVGVTLDANGQISGAPADFGAFDFEVRVTDAETRTATQALHLLVVSKQPMISTATLARAHFLEPYEARLEIAGGRAPYTFEISSGGLPTGVGLDTAGVIAGAPSVSGVFRFTVRAIDSAGERDEKDLSLTVLAPLVITTRALPQVVIARPVNIALEASGGLAPYVWSLASGILPAGLSFSADGRITGTTTEQGDYPLTIRVDDSSGAMPRQAQLTLRVSDILIFEVTPMLAFPAVCTGTTVSYQTVEIPVVDSVQIAEISVSVDVDFVERNSPNNNRKLKLLLWSPDGRQSVLCGNAAGLRQETGCDGSGGIHTTFDSPTAAEVPLRVFQGMNPRGTWRFQAAVVRPQMNAGGCLEEGTINRVTLNIRDDRRPDPYVIVSGFSYNNLIIDPWIRIGGGRTIGETEIFLSATLWQVGPNGIREGGQGDDIPDPRTFTWTGAALPLGATITPDGHVSGARCQPSGCRSDEGTVTADDGQGNSVTRRLLVVPPDWNRAVRQF